jgi:hypothetical protein
MGKVRALLAALVLMVALAGCGGGAGAKPAAPATSTTAAAIQVRGTLILNTTSLTGGSLEDMSSGAAACRGSNGYDDIAGGAQVTVTDEASKVVGVGALDPGQFNKVSSNCMFRFTVDGVTPGRPFYGVEIAHRGVVRFQGADVLAPSLTLGDGS